MGTGARLKAAHTNTETVLYYDYSIILVRNNANVPHSSPSGPIMYLNNIQYINTPLIKAIRAVSFRGHALYLKLPFSGFYYNNDHYTVSKSYCTNASFSPNV